MSDSTSLPRVYVLGASLTIQFGPFLEAALAWKMHYDRKRDTPGERAEDDLDSARRAQAEFIAAELLARYACDEERGRLAPGKPPAA